MSRLSNLKFAAAIAPDLLKLGQTLYQAFAGDPDRARATLRRITDYKALIAEDRAAIDAELERTRRGPS